MIIYYVLILLVIVPGFFSKSRRNIDIYFSWVFLLLLSISTLRGYVVGGDLLNYLPKFKEIADSPWSELFTRYDKYGFLFTLYIKCSSVISTNLTWYLFTTSLFNLSVPLFFIKKYCKIPWLGIFLYIALGYYTNTFNSVRSSMSLACGMIAIDFLIREKKSYAFLWSIIAIEIHKTIFPILLLLFLGKIKPTFWKLTIAISTSIIVANAFGLASIMDVLIFYKEMNNYSDSSLPMEMGGKGYNLLILDIIILYTCYFIQKRNPNRLNFFFIMILTMATCIQAATPLYSLLTRIAYFFTVYMIVLIPNTIVGGFTKESRKFCIAAVLAIALLYFKMFIMTPSDQFAFKSNSQGTIPYYFFWENRPNL